MLFRKKNKSNERVSIKKVFKTIIWPKRKFLLIGLFLIIINRLSGLVLPGASKVLIDDVIGANNLELMKWLLMGVSLAIVFQSVTSFFLTRLLSVEAQYMIAMLRSKVQKHVIQLPIRYFDNHKSGELVSRVMTDVEGVRNLVGTGLVQLFGGVLTAIIAFFLLINISPLLTVYVLVPLVVFGLVSLKAFGYIRPIFRERSKINAEVTGRLTESIGGIRVIKGFNSEDKESEAFNDGVIRLYKNVKKSLTSTSLVTSMATLLLGLASVGIMGIGGKMIIEGELTIGDFFAFTLYLGFMIAPIVQMSNIGSQITEAFAGLDRMEEIMSEPTEHDNAERSLHIRQLGQGLTFEDVHFSYENGKPVLRDISFEMQPGTVTALVGSSGSGKSTIAGLASSFLSPTAGKVLIDGSDLSKVVLNDYRKHLGVVLQDDFMFEGTIRENITYPVSSYTENELIDAVKAAHVHEFTDRFEDGLETTIGERGVKLSGGQRQRLAIARALLVNPDILILDEATSNLDAESERYIKQSLDQLMKGRTTLVIAHRLSTIRKADQILVIEDGRISERGNHEELLDQKGRYYDLYNFQVKI